MAARIDNDLSRAWGLALLSLWHDVKGDHPQLAQLRAPRFFAGMPMGDVLAQWTPEYRVIQVSESLLQDYDWDNIEGVIKHEIAHQVVDELFGMSDAAPHGEPFRRACKLLGIPDDATWRPMPNAATEAPILVRIRKLLALGGSDNANEAAAALAKARALAAQHDVDLLDRISEVEGQPVSLRPVGQTWKRVPGWYWFVMSIVERCAFVQYICRGVPSETGGSEKIMEIYGSAEHLELGSYVHDFLINKGEELWYRCRCENPGIGGRMKGSYLKGLYAGVLERLESADECDEIRQAGLIALDDPRLEALFRRRNPRVTRSRRPITARKSVMDQGLADSDRLQIHPGVRQAGAQKQISDS